MPEASLAAAKMADKAVSIKDQKLMDVKLGQLPSWLAARDFSLKGIVYGSIAIKERFFAKYINVKNMGIGGISMLLTGYVVMSYMWSYPHIKTERMRKYH
uniref:ATP synthase F(0) complex subunit f, mitochondrial n=1 Tax=Pogona vitticeps TaxID=103695 RepID=A0ABM5EZY9_9SAUR